MECEGELRHTHTHTYIYIHTHTYIHTYTHTYTYIHTHTHIYIKNNLYLYLIYYKVQLVKTNSILNVLIRIFFFFLHTRKEEVHLGVREEGGGKGVSESSFFFFFNHKFAARQIIKQAFYQPVNHQTSNPWITEKQKYKTPHTKLAVMLNMRRKERELVS